MSTSGYVDVQVNGFGGVDFNRDGLTPEGLSSACEALRADGVARFLPTIITDAPAKMGARLRRLAALRDGDALAREMIAGFHIEGPFIGGAPGYIGAHPPGEARDADPGVMERLLDDAAGLTRIVTLAPERDRGLTVTRMLADRGVVVAAGHCDPTLDELRAGIDAGLAMFTHLGNGCPLTMHRHDNIIQRVLSLADRLYVSFIADGAHVPLFVLRNYLRIVPEDRVVITSDAMSAAGLGPGAYTLGDQSVVIGDDLAPRNAQGYLMGSACPLSRMVGLLEGMGIEEASIRGWTVDNPMKVLGLSQATTPGG